MTDELTRPTDAATWRAARETGDLVRLPGCGHVARLRRVSLLTLALDAGQVPNHYAETLIQLMAVDDAPRDRLTASEQIAIYKRNARAFHIVASLSLVSPVLVLDRAPGDGEIGPQDLADIDYTWLFYTWTQGSFDQTRPFRLTGDADSGRSASAALPLSPQRAPRGARPAAGLAD